MAPLYTKCIDDWRNHRRFDPRDADHHLHTWTVQLLGNSLVAAGFIVGSGDIEVKTRTRPGRLTAPLFRFLPHALFNVVCQVWAVPTRRRELFAVVRPNPDADESK